MDVVKFDFVVALAELESAAELLLDFAEYSVFVDLDFFAVAVYQIDAIEFVAELAAVFEIAAV